MKIILKTCLLAVGVLAILLIGLSSLSGVKVEIVNLGPRGMQNVSVDVTGASYPIGDIPAGTSKSIKVKPRSASSVSIKHSDSTGKQHNLFIDTYIESGGSGKITDVKQDTKSTPIG